MDGVRHCFGPWASVLVRDMGLNPTQAHGLVPGLHHGEPLPAMLGQDWQWPAMASWIARVGHGRPWLHGWPWLANVVHRRPWLVGHGHGWPCLGQPRPGPGPAQGLAKTGLLDMAALFHKAALLDKDAYSTRWLY